MANEIIFHSRVGDRVGVGFMFPSEDFTPGMKPPTPMSTLPATLKVLITPDESDHLSNIGDLSCINREIQVLDSEGEDTLYAVARAAYIREVAFYNADIKSKSRWIGQRIDAK